MRSLQFVTIKFLQLVHFLVVVFVIFGFLFSSHAILLFHLGLIPALIVHWKTNANVCYLTQLENRVQKKSIHRDEIEGGFSERLFIKLFGKKPTKKFLQNLIYAIMGVSFTISLIKFCGA